MHYERTVQNIENGPALLEACLHVLLPLGFELLRRTDTQVIVRGPGMNNTKQSALLGMSRGEFSWDSTHQMHIYAELGGLRRMQLFMLLFPPTLIGVLGFFFYFFVPNGALWTLNTAPAMLLTWLLIGFLMGLWLKKRVYSALDIFVNNAVELARTKP